jgi:hypothetical protein
MKPPAEVRDYETMDTQVIKKQSRKLALLLTGFAMFGVTLLASPTTQALTCTDTSMLDEGVRNHLNDLVAGTTYKIGPAKKVVIHSVESIVGNGECDVLVKANITLKRAIRRDAHGTMTLFGKLDTSNGQVCITNAKAVDFDLDRTLDVGENAYTLMAPYFNKCF